MDVQEVQSDWAAMRAEFPQGVSIIASSFEEWAAAALTPATLSTLPVIDIEMGDTWVHGVSADSLKTHAASKLFRMEQCGERVTEQRPRRLRVKIDLWKR